MRQKRTPPPPPLTPMQYYQLCTEHCFIPTEALSSADLPQAWIRMRDALVLRYAQDCPGNRPHAWWLIEAPMPRQCLVGAHDCPQREVIIREHMQGRLYYGRPAVYPCPGCFDEVYESQARYLRRNGLLLPTEDNLVPKDLAACDTWAAQHYEDDHPHPWATGEALKWCAAVLRGVGG